MSELAAVVGIGQTHHKSARTDVSIAGLVREAASRALDDAEMRWQDIDAVVIGKAPDMFEGVVMPEAYLADALGAAGKPMMRVHTAGSVGRSTALVAASLVQAGIHERLLTVAFEEQSDPDATRPLSRPLPFAAPAEPIELAGRDAVSPHAGTHGAADVSGQDGITNPRDQIDCLEMYGPCSGYEPMWVENLGFVPEGDGWKMTDKGATAHDGELP